MNSICIHKEEISASSLAILKDRKRIDHIRRHLKSKQGDTVKVTQLNIGIFEAVITLILDNEIHLEITKELQKKEGWFHLLIGLSRPQTIKKVLEHSSTFGADSITVAKAKLSEKSYGTSKIYEDSAFEEYLIDGISQSKTYYKIPDFKIMNYLNLENFKKIENKFFLSLNSKKTFLDHKEELINPLITVGPERGWTKKEEELLIENGFQPIGISDSCLRVEHATFSAISQLELIRLSLSED